MIGHGTAAGPVCQTCKEPLAQRPKEGPSHFRTRRFCSPRCVAKAPRRPLETRFWAKVDKRSEDECWLWIGHVGQWGYGQIGTTKGATWAHRVAYELLVGPIPTGYQIDHLCHTRDKSCPGRNTCPHRRCVNPAHLEPVTQGVNKLRGRSPAAINATKTTCPAGHPYSETNTAYRNNGKQRKCRACDNERHRRNYRARKSRQAATSKETLT